MKDSRSNICSLVGRITAAVGPAPPPLCFRGMMQYDVIVRGYGVVDREDWPFVASWWFPTSCCDVVRLGEMPPQVSTTSHWKGDYTLLMIKDTEEVKLPKTTLYFRFILYFCLNRIKPLDQILLVESHNHMGKNLPQSV